MRLSPTLKAALLLVLVTNAVVLTGVAWNRRGEPDAVLTLSEHEVLATSNDILPDEENSGATLRLNWAVNPPRAQDEELYAYLPYSWSEAAWLDRDKLATLGFDVSFPPASDAASDHYGRMLAREALLVLELDGPASQAAAAYMRELAERARNCASGTTQDVTPAECRRANLAAHERPLSRLFVVDAGRDARALRQRYPDRTRYAIVRGAVRPRLAGKPQQLYGSVTTLHCEYINVPKQVLARLRPVAQAIDRGRAPPVRVMISPPVMRVTIAFGARAEPWILSADAP